VVACGRKASFRGVGLEYEEVREWLHYDQIESLLASQSPEWLKPPAAESS